MRNRYSNWIFPINALPASQLVKAGIDEISWHPDIKTEAVRRYYSRVDADLLFFFSDIVIQAEALGAKVRYSADAMPSVRAPARVIGASERAAAIPRMRVNGQVVRAMRRQFSSKQIAALVYGPFTVAGQLMGEKEILRGVLESPDEILGLLQKITDYAKDYGRYLLDSGADLLWISDPLPALLPPDYFWRFAGTFLHQIFEIYPAGPGFLHICGDTSQIVREMVRTGASGISLDQCINLLAVEDLFPESVQIIGNIDPEVVEMGSSQEIAATVRDLVCVMGMKTNFTLSSGCGLPPATPVVNVIDFIESGRRCRSEIEPHADRLQEVGESVHAGEGEKVPEVVARGLREGIDPLMLVNSGLMRAVRKSSDRYEAKHCYLPEMLMIADAFYKGFKTLEPGLDRGADRTPQVVLGTVKGDFHEIGKDLVRIILESNNIKVLDLGVNVGAEQFRDAVATQQIPVVCLSAFITSARKRLAEIVDTLNVSGLSKIPIFIGGAAANQQIAVDIGARGYGRDAVSAVKLVKRALQKII